MAARIIVSGGQKGGTGKTMLATNLAVHYARQHRSVLIVEADSQRSSASWCEDRLKMVCAETVADVPKADRIPSIDCKELTGNLFYSLLELERHYDYIIVDAGGADSDEFRTAVAKAHAVYPTVMSSKCDLKTMTVVDQVARQARSVGNRGLVAKVLINKAPANAQSAWRIETAREVLSKFKHLQVATSVIAFRVTFQDAYDANKAVVEVDPTSKAAQELAAFFEEVDADAR